MSETLSMTLDRLGLNPTPSVLSIRNCAIAARDLEHKLAWYSHEHAKLTEACDDLASDAMTLAMRLYAESDDTFAPETIEVMKRWRPKVLAKLQGK
jgi:hypothetical protein